MSNPYWEAFWQLVYDEARRLDALEESESGQTSDVPENADSA